MERLRAEIKELSYGLKGKREDAAKLGQRKVWESYEDVSLTEIALQKSRSSFLLSD
jgi:hypothetical protein